MYTYFEDDNYVYLVLEMCQNGEVNRYLKKNGGKMSESQGIYAELLYREKRACN